MWYITDVDGRFSPNNMVSLGRRRGLKTFCPSSLSPNHRHGMKDNGESRGARPACSLTRSREQAP